MSRWTDPGGAYIRLCPTGRKFFFLSARPEDYQLKEIVYHMARINRYTGGSTFTNGQHSVVASRMARQFYPGDILLPARMLIHDMAESVLGDVSSPLKSLLPDYRALEIRHDVLVEKRFDLLFVGDPMVKEVDDRMWLTERLNVYPALSRKDDYAGPLREFELDDDEFVENFIPWSTEVVEHEFHLAITELLPWVQ